MELRRWGALAAPVLSLVLVAETPGIIAPWK